MTAVQRKLYTDILNGVISEIRKTVNGAVMVSELASKVLRLRQVLNHPALVGGDDTAESCKYNELDLILEELLSQDGMRVLIWTQWRDSVSKLCARYKEYGALPLIGGSNDKQVRDALRSGQCRVVVAIPEKAGTSIDWLQLCRAAVYLEKPWSLVLYRQSLDRIDRRSNTDPALIMFIECQRSVDQLVNAVLTKRQGVMDALSLDEDKLISLGKEEVLQLLRQ
jgi:SNF2 family DNA or RNA helicase